MTMEWMREGDEEWYLKLHLLRNFIRRGESEVCVFPQVPKMGKWVEIEKHAIRGSLTCMARRQGIWH